MTQNPDDLEDDSPCDPNDDPVRSALIEAEVKRASRPFEGVLPDEVLEEMRRLHRIALRTHPDLQSLLDQLSPEPRVKRSNKIATAKFRAKKDKKAGGES
jgi:hypothetical protein